MCAGQVGAVAAAAAGGVPFLTPAPLLPLTPSLPPSPTHTDCTADSVSFSVSVESSGSACVCIKVKVQEHSHFRPRPSLFLVRPGAPASVRMQVADRERYLAAVAQGGGRHRSTLQFHELEVLPEEEAALGEAEQGSAAAFKARLSELYKRLEGAGRPTKVWPVHAEAQLPQQVLQQAAQEEGGGGSQQQQQQQHSQHSQHLHHGHHHRHPAAHESASGAGKEASGTALEAKVAQLMGLLHTEREVNNSYASQALQAEALISQLRRANEEWIPLRDVSVCAAWHLLPPRTPSAPGKHAHSLTRTHTHTTPPCTGGTETEQGE